MPRQTPNEVPTTPTEDLIKSVWSMFGVELAEGALRHPDMPEFQRLLYLVVAQRSKINSAVANLSYRLAVTFDVAAAYNLADQELYRLAEANQQLTYCASQARHVLTRIAAPRRDV